ncbi:hypothetical protein GCM10022198_23090 [Klugiella xanthotipulae]|uniref:Antibiotic biosynthesis monooxygenase n=1 Tax=Klugiella xanthotipulae TaxID=244735 RepID=A0A543I5T5_9MICO|nr:hypothetical protein [Klugiella xanthotipulae]TQM65963.1 hypothetical protein FB466_0783 [Klugiella xanthotipulae]
MSSTIEYARFEASDETALVASRDSLVSVLRKKYGPDFISAFLGRFEDGSFLEMIVWASPEAAQRAAREMPSLPEASGFFSAISDVREMHHITQLHAA